MYHQRLITLLPHRRPKQQWLIQVIGSSRNAIRVFGSSGSPPHHLWWVTFFSPWCPLKHRLFTPLWPPLHVSKLVKVGDDWEEEVTPMPGKKEAGSGCRSHPHHYTLLAPRTPSPASSGVWQEERVFTSVRNLSSRWTAPRLHN